MKNLVSEHGFLIEGEDGDEDKDSVGDENDGNGFEFSSGSDQDNPHNQGKTNSFHTLWPQTYRKSIDLYGSLQSPSLIWESPNLSRSSGSFLSSPFTRRHSPEIIPTLNKPLLSHRADNEQPQVTRKLSHYQNSTKVSHELPVTRKSSYGQAVINGVNLLCGIGLLSTPYAVKEGGWVGLSLLFIFCVITLYTGILLRYCLDSQPGLESYPDIGQAAFGTTGRLIISIVLYVELYACCVEYIILESDNLSSLFPNAHLSLGGYLLGPHYLFAIVVTLAVLPTVWLRDMSILSYISAGGVFVSVLVVVCLFWVGLVDNIGFQTQNTKALNLATLPMSIGLYGSCYAGHAVLPNIYMSMEKRSQFPLVLLASFGICTVLYTGVAIMGYMMFGESTESQFTLNLPSKFVASKIAVWTTVISPFTKYALTIIPVALGLEELIPSNPLKSHIYSILIRTTLVISTLLVALTVPFFGLMMSLIGSLLSMLVSLIFPCACFMSIRRGKITRSQGAFCIVIITVGIVSSVLGTHSALSGIIHELF